MSGKLQVVPDFTAKVGTRYHATCLRACQKPGCPACRAGQYHDCLNKYVAWEEPFHNLVVMEGRNKLLDSALKAGNTATSWYVALKNSAAGIADGDTMNSHAGWTEFTGYSQGTRQGFVPGAISNGTCTNSASPASFTISAGGTVYGAFLTSSNVLSGTVGTLYGVGDLGTARQVAATDTLNMRVDNIITSS